MGVLAASWQLLDLQEEILVTQWSAEEGLGTAAGKKYDALHPVDEQAEIDVKTEIKETPALSFCVIFCYLSAYLGCVPLGCEAQRAGLLVDSNRKGLSNAFEYHRTQPRERPAPTAC